jgi:hypothetical protein
MPTMNDLREFSGIFVSPLNVNFQEVAVVDVPPQFYADWVELVVQIAKISYPQFSVPPLPKPLTFMSGVEAVGYYSEDEFSIKTQSYLHKGDSEFGILIKSHDGYEPADGADPGWYSNSPARLIQDIGVETVGLPSVYPDQYYSVKSYIQFQTGNTLANFLAYVEAQNVAQVEAAFAQHRASKS